MNLGAFAIPGYYVGDCRDLLAQLPDESVNCVVTSPPYFGLRDYGTATWEGGDAACAHAGRQKPRRNTTNDGTFADVRGTQPSKAAAVPVKDVCRCGARRVDKQIGLEPTPDDFVASMVSVFREVRRVLRGDGTIWVNLGDSFSNIGKWGGSTSGKHAARLHGDHETSSRATGGKIEGLKPKDLIGIPWKVAFALQADGWYLRSDIIWHKPNPMPESVQDRPTKAHEYLFLLSKSERYFYDAAAIRETQVAPEASTPDDRARAFSRRRATVPAPGQDGYRPWVGKNEEAGVAVAESTNRLRNGFNERWRQAEGENDGLRNKRSVWTVASRPYHGAHFATFPEALVVPCILAGCPAGGVVLDPFMGSGTVGRVAEDLGRRWLGFDLNPAYAELAKVRTAQVGMFGGAMVEETTQPHASLSDTPLAPRPGLSPARADEREPREFGPVAGTGVDGGGVA